jgi:ribonuclease P protein component
MTAASDDRVEFRKLRRRSEFLRAATGKRVGRPSLSLQVIDAPGDQPGLGLTVTKKQGDAPERNRIKRRLRAAARACDHAFRPQHDYVLVGRREALAAPFEKLVSDLNSAIAKAHTDRATGTPRQ